MTNFDYATQKLAEQKQRIRQLEKEADWLADELAQRYAPATMFCADCEHAEDNDDLACSKCWRVAARKAVNND